MPSGQVGWVVSGVSAKFGAKGSAPQLSAPTGAFVGLDAFAPACDSRVILLVVCGPMPVQAVGFVRKPPLPIGATPVPMLPLKISREETSGRAGDT